ncbi:methylamine utilization protein [Parasphingorhabdus cellanae]|uniref:Methylamine utilization protein n=1 Tax=Parasphingorhabdus cellanae TaxID=2806553 RepID=A0ABX7TAK8_9SPHN|nr:methylamine utilization protein [Parasphingorhabdus cellanae]
MVAIIPFGSNSVVSSQSPAGARLNVAVKDGNGVPVRDAVIMVYPAKGSGGLRYKSGKAVMNQRNIQFDPGTIIVGKGTTVSFPNRDRVRHNVYSFSKAARFEMKLYGKDQSRSQNFPIAGTVALGCNIHDEMKGFVKVVDTPYAAKTDHNGLVQIASLPSGSAKLKVWHPKNRVRGGETVIDIAITGSVANQTVKLALRR